MYISPSPSFLADAKTQFAKLSDLARKNSSIAQSDPVGDLVRSVGAEGHRGSRGAKTLRFGQATSSWAARLVRSTGNRWRHGTVSGYKQTISACLLQVSQPQQTLGAALFRSHLTSI